MGVTVNEGGFMFPSMASTDEDSEGGLQKPAFINYQG
jgi:hypothetical protein